MRLTILGGFLGSGKTTWLRHQLHEGRFAKAFVIVNEAAETPVDDALLGRAFELAVLAGGCVCCTAKDELLRLLRRLCDRRSRERSFDEIVLETSGLADPGAIAAAIRADPILVHHIVLGEIITTVDALHALAQLRDEALGRRQIEAADRMVVTKTDVVEIGALKRLIATLKCLNPIAILEGAATGTPVQLPDASDSEPERLPDLTGAPEQAPIVPARVTIGSDIDWPAFTVWLSALLHARGDDVVRVKGVVRTPAGRLLLQSVRKVMQRPEILPEQEAREDNTIVLIGRGYTEKELHRSLRRFAEG